MTRRAVVVKIGSSTLVDAGGRARRRVFANVAEDAAALMAEGTPVAVESFSLTIGTRPQPSSVSSVRRAFR